MNTLNKKNNSKCLIFNFGNVDLYFSYYYKKFVKKERFMMESMIKNYVEFISNIDCNNCNKIILGIYPSVLQDKNVFNSLLSYGILSEETINSINEKEKEKVSKYKFRYNLYKKFNTLLKKYSKIYNINYIDFDEILLDKNKKVKKKFINPSSNRGIHLLWEPLIPILLKKINKCGIKNKYKFNLQKSLNKYIKNKIKT